MQTDSQIDCRSKPSMTFVHTDTDTFREVVQRLTGASEPHTPEKLPPGSKRPTSKLHERRHWAKPKLHIVKPAVHFKPSSTTDRSPVGTPSKIFSELSIMDGKKEHGVSELNSMEEEKAIKERRFYLHPSPRSSMSRYCEPELLTLFPLESPKTSQKSRD